MFTVQQFLVMRLAFKRIDRMATELSGRIPDCKLRIVIKTLKARPRELVEEVLLEKLSKRLEVVDRELLEDKAFSQVGVPRRIIHCA